MYYKSLLQKTNGLLLIFSFLFLPAAKCFSQPKPPEVIYKLGEGEGRLVRLPDGRFMLFKMDGNKLVSMVSSDGHTWFAPKREIKNNEGIKSGLVIVDNSGELQNIYSVSRSVPQKPGGLTGPGATKMIDLYHVKTIKGRSRWGKPQRIFKGYCGAFIDFKQLRNGRLILPFAYWVPSKTLLPTGSNVSTVIYSDDGGNNWKMSNSRLTSPAYKDYPASNYGAIEPAITELAEEGHLYMLLRTGTGFLYESYSMDNGTNWTPASPSRFHTFNSPALLKELPDHRLFMVWNNADNSPTYKGKGVYGGRDALQAAISDDYGKTWKGFREIDRDPLRNNTPPKLGDRGTAYSNSPIGVNGKIMLITGMGKDRRHIVFIDPDWLTAKHHESDFSKGLDEWSVFKLFGPVSNWWRDRVVGPELVDHPTKAGVKVLHIRRPDEKDPDGAVWNFPNGRSGKLSLRIMLNEGFQGGKIALTDRFFNPSDSHGERLAMYCLSLKASGQLGKKGPVISIGKWHKLDFIWDLDNKSCKVITDGRPALVLPLNNETLNGLSYLRLRSTAPSVDKAGFLIESVVVDVDNNIAPPAGEKAKEKAAADYRAKLSYSEYKEDSLYSERRNISGSKVGNITSSGHWVAANVKEMTTIKAGGLFVRLPGNRILSIYGNKSCISTDEGQTWQEYSILADTSRFKIGPGALIRTRKGVIILSFTNLKEKANWNWQKDIHDSPGSILPTYAVRSLDGGKTWQDMQKLHDEWTGANRDMIETNNGNVVFTSMMMRHNPGHHTVLTYTTKDDGKTWIQSNIIDLGGVGHHSGVMESTLVQLKDGRLWMLLRTNWGNFWQTFSNDDGLTWKDIGPTNIDASSSPGMIKRLKSGRLILVWNRLFPEGKNDFRLRGGEGYWSEVPTNWQRDELSVMFSNDDGISWSHPVVIAKKKGKATGLSYPHLFEVKAGELWITAGALRIKIHEKDFL